MRIGVSFALANGSAVESIPSYALHFGTAKKYYSHED